jgi:uncharacterized protein (DUF1800 family)
LSSIYASSMDTQQVQRLQRLEIARLFHRTGFGPKPGEFAQALNAGVVATRNKILAAPSTVSFVTPPVFTDLGPRPAPNSPTVVDYSQQLRYQNQLLFLWWLDEMVASPYSLQEKMTWFWHGHWATSIAKVNYALPMFNQNVTMRKFALGNFTEFAKAMFSDGALQLWLDGGDNTVKAPNENLSREMMELFTLGVDRYTEKDVKELARAFTGYQVSRTTGVVTYNARRRDTSSVTVLGKTGVMSPEEVIKYLVSQNNSALFIAERIWYRFVSSQVALPNEHPMIKAFADRDIYALMKSLIESSAFSQEENSIVKSPIEWFIGLCRALSLTPSAMPSPTKLYGYLEMLSQVPFAPPNVGGWPADEAWLSSASAQFRVSFATSLAAQANLAELTAVSAVQRPAYLADLLGVVEWSTRTAYAMRAVRDNPQKLLIIAACSPEYVVSQ